MFSFGGTMHRRHASTLFTSMSIPQWYSTAGTCAPGSCRPFWSNTLGARLEITALTTVAMFIYRTRQSAPKVNSIASAADNASIISNAINIRLN